MTAMRVPLFRVRAVLFLVLVLSAWLMCQVFVGHFVAQRGNQRRRTRLRSASVNPATQLNLSWPIFQQAVQQQGLERAPMIDGKPLELGALVGYWLNSKPTKVIHAAIYVGTGHWQLRRKTGMSDLSPRKHYVMEVCGPNQTIDLLGSQVVKLVRGKGGQMVQLSEMVPCRMWCAYELDSSHYGSPLNGRSTRSRALQFLNSSDGYDLFWNNCQHFAVWARYDKEAMLPLEDQLQAGSEARPWAVARTGKMSQKIIDFKWVLHVDHELQMDMFEYEVEIVEIDLILRHMKRLDRLVQLLREGLSAHD